MLKELTGIDILNLAKQPIIIQTEGYLSKARVFFEEPGQLAIARDKLRYFEVFAGSSKWSYGLSHGDYVRPRDYDSISDQIVFVSKIPEGFWSRDIDGIFCAFGQIVFCKLKVDS